MKRHHAPGRFSWPPMARRLALGLAALAAANLATATTPRVAARISPEVLARVERGERAVPALVTLRDDAAAQQSADVAQPSARRLLRLTALEDGFIADHTAAGMHVRRRFSHLPILAVDLDAEQLAALAGDSRVVAVTPSRRFHALDTEGKALMHVPAVTSLGYDGSGIGIAVLDSGVDYTHPELSPGGTDASAKTVTLFDAIDGQPNFQDVVGHGTSVAGIAAGSQTGVAPGARVVAVRVLDNSGNATSEQVLAGINAVIASVEDGNPFNIRVANLSFGGYDPASWPPFEGTCDDIADDFKTAFDTLTADGVMVVAAGGNGGCEHGVDFPACISSALAVGAVYDARICTSPPPTSCQVSYTLPDGCLSSCTGDADVDRIACYSDSGEKLDAWAPAGCATVPTLGGGTEACFDGTSAAAPYVSGVIALLAQAFPSATTTELRNTLRATGRSLTDSRNGVTRNRIDALAALSTLQTCTVPATPEGLASSASSVCKDEPFDLTWEPAEAASGYTVQVAGDPAFTTGLLTFATVNSALSLSLTGTESYTAYAHVRADTDCGVSTPFSAPVQIAYQPTCGTGGSQTSWVLGVAHGPGVAPAFFYTDLAVLNPGVAQASLTLTFYGSSASRQFLATVSGGHQATWNDVLVTGFGLDGDDVGMIRVDSSEPVMVTARTYSRPTDAPDRSYGQLLTGLGPEAALTANQVGTFMALRSDNPYGGPQPFRSNVLFGNVGNVTATVEVRFFNNGGAQVGSVTLSGIAPRTQRLATYALPPNVSSAFAEVRVQPVGARVIGVASIVDGTSTDPTTIPLTIQ